MKEKSLNIFTNELLIKYEIRDYPFSTILTNLFNLSSLETLHREVASLDGFNGDLGKDSESALHKIFYTNIKKYNSDLRKTWDKFLDQVVINNYNSNESYLVQKLPNIRIHIPGAKAINRWHCDSDDDHNHPLGEINCILPLTRMFDSNSVWRESDPNRGDFLPFDLQLGELVYWNGNTCIHGNKVNKTDITRVSLDFRILSKEKYYKWLDSADSKKVQTATMGTKFIIGSYYKTI